MFGGMRKSSEIHEGIMLRGDEHLGADTLYGGSRGESTESDL